MPLTDPNDALPSTDDLEALSDDDRRLIVELLPDGRMRAPEQATRDILRDRLRRAEVLPTGHGWAVLRALAPSEVSDDKAQRQVVAAGTMDEAGLSVIDFIGFLASGYQTGVLTVSTGDVERSIYMHNGDVVWASSSAPDDRLGELLVTRGKISREQLDEVLEGGERRIGQRCVDLGFIAAHDLWSMVQAQLKEIFDRLLAMESGVWSFARVSEEVLAESQIHMSTQGLLVDALRRLDELQVYRQRIRSADVVVERKTSANAADVSDTQEGLERVTKELRTDGAQMLAVLPASASIRALMRLVGKSEFEVTRTVYHLLRANLVEIVAQETGPIPRRNPITSKQAAEIIEIYSMAMREMFEEAARIHKAALLHKTTADFLRDEASGTQFTAFYKTVRVDTDGSLDAARILANLESADLEPQQLSDALSEVMFFILFQATEVLGRRRGDDLARRVKMIHGMLSNGLREDG